MKRDYWQRFVMQARKPALRLLPIISKNLVGWTLVRPFGRAELHSDGLKSVLQSTEVGPFGRAEVRPTLLLRYREGGGCFRNFKILSDNHPEIKLLSLTRTAADILFLNIKNQR